MRSVEVGEMIYIVFYYYLRRANRGGAENDIFREKKSVILLRKGGPPGIHRTIRRGTLSSVAEWGVPPGTKFRDVIGGNSL